MMIVRIVNGVESIQRASPSDWYASITSWNYLLVTLYFILSFGLSFTKVVLGRCGKSENVEETIPINSASSSTKTHSPYTETNDDKLDPKSVPKKKLPKKLKFFWVLFNVAINICVLVVIGYWVLMHDYKKKRESKMELFLTLDKHGINLLLIVLDFTMHKIPTRLLHFVYPVFVVISYIFFSLIYWAITGENIYTFLQWNKNIGNTIGTSTVATLLVPVIQSLWYLFHKGKDRSAKQKETAV